MAELKALKLSLSSVGIIVSPHAAFSGLDGWLFRQPRQAHSNTQSPPPTPSPVYRVCVTRPVLRRGTEPEEEAAGVATSAVRPPCDPHLPAALNRRPGPVGSAARRQGFLFSALCVSVPLEETVLICRDPTNDPSRRGLRSTVLQNTPIIGRLMRTRRPGGRHWKARTPVMTRGRGRSNNAWPVTRWPFSEARLQPTTHLKSVG